MKKVQDLVHSLNKKSHVDHILLDKINHDNIKKFDIIVNTTSVGMTPDVNKSTLDQSLILEKHTVFDIVYSPHQTLLLKTAEKKGCRIIHGIEMLINQGAAQFEIWTGKKAPREVMWKALNSQIS